MATSRWIGGALIALTVGIVVGVVTVRRDRPTAEVDTPTATIAIYGRAGSLGRLDDVPSGQRLERRAVPGWGFPGGTQAGPTTIGNDGTVFVASQSYHEKRTARETVIAAFEPHTNAYTPIHLRTTTGQDHAGTPTAPSVSDVEPIAGGAAIAFTTGPTLAGQDVWPVVGLLTKVDGRWQVAGRDGWTNQWTAADLVRANPRVCPNDRGCASLGDMAVLPKSHDLVVARRNGLVALRVAGPDGAGRYTVSVLGQFIYPDIPGLELAVISIHADPTSQRGDERFAVIVRVTDPKDPLAPQVAQEFGYDDRSGTIRPVSAPFLPGDQVSKDGDFFGFSKALYDHSGNLWLARHRGLGGGKLAVYARLLCPYDAGRPLASYRTVRGKSAWGQSCKPDYDILQAREMLVAIGLVEDPATRSVVMLSLLGALLPVRVSGDAALTFAIGNVVDTGSRLLPLSQDSFVNHSFGGIDGDHRLWFPVVHSHIDDEKLREPADQWLYAVSIPELFEPPPVAIPDVPGRGVTIQAEYTTTTTTTNRPGTWATQDVDSAAYRTGCLRGTGHTGCASDETIGDGFALRDDSGYGVLYDTLEYRIRVPRTGKYRISYRVFTFDATKAAKIDLRAGDRTYTTMVSTNGAWQTRHETQAIQLEAGVQTISLAPANGGGWYLNSFTLRRA